MMIECMAGKSAAVHGVVHDATPFKYSEEDTAIDFFGKLLEAGEVSIFYWKNYTFSLLDSEVAHIFVQYLPIYQQETYYIINHNHVSAVLFIYILILF